jgi:hypothetical protein
MIKLLSICLILASVTVAKKCNRSETSDKTQEAQTITDGTEETDMMVYKPLKSFSIERTACYGSCPVYSATFFEDGSVEYNGYKFVDSLGAFKGKVEQQDVHLLIDFAVNEVDFLNLNDSYVKRGVSDLPKCKTTLFYSDTFKTITTMSKDMPEDLSLFQIKIEECLSKVTLSKTGELPKRVIKN